MHVERRPELTQKQFIDEYLSVNKPVIVTDAMKSWDLSWNLDEWNSRFGEEAVQIYDDLFQLINVATLSSFISQSTGGKWTPESSRIQPYIRWYTKMKDIDFVWADDVFEKIADKWSRPEFLPESDYLLPCSGTRRLDPTKDLFPGKGLFISGAGARTRLHRDPWASDAVLCQLYGKKEVKLYSPAVSVSLVSSGKTVDVDKPDEELFPKFRETSPTAEDVLNPAEILFIPRGWYHHVYSLTDSVSLTWNFVHLTTGRAYLEYLMSPESREAHDVLRFFLEEPRLF
jgi:hypothetical protein